MGFVYVAGPGEGRGAEDADLGALVTAAAGGDPAAWRELVRRFSGLVWSITRAYRLSRADAADVSQTAWLRLAEHIGKISNPERVGAWLATATRRECLQSLKVAARTVPTEDMTWFDDKASGESPTEGEVLRAEAEREDAQRAVALRQAFGRLPHRCSELLRVLMATPPPSYADVAAALDLPVGSIGPTRARCLQRLRQELGGLSSGPGVRHQCGQGYPRRKKEKVFSAWARTPAGGIPVRGRRLPRA